MAEKSPDQPPASPVTDALADLPATEFAVLTVGSSVAGSKSNIIPDRARLLVNLRTYDTDVRRRMIDGIERMVRAE